jgi:hypothetical protein
MIYKYIDINNYEIISEKIYDFVLTKTDILQGNPKQVWNNLSNKQFLDCVPELAESFKELGQGLSAVLITIFKVEPKTNISVHTDGGNHARLLWPVRNCKGSYTKFYEVDERNIEKRNTGDGKYAHILNVKDANLLESVELIKPIVFKPWIPHGIMTNPSCEEPRLTLTISFNKSLEYLLK